MSQIETQAKQEIKLNIASAYDRTPIAGAHFALYEFGQFESAQSIAVDEDFEDYPVDVESMTEDNWNDLALTLATYAARDQLEPVCEGTADEDGLLTFTESEDHLESAIYLVVGTAIDIDYVRYTFEPFFISLPGTNAGNYVYEQTAYPKVASEILPYDGVVQVVKLWDDAGMEESRPESIEVQLLIDGKVADTVTLSQNNNWRYTWNELNPDGDWSVLEKSVPDGYTLTIAKSDDTYTLTNKSTGTPAASSGGKLPQTGLNWLPPLTLFAMGTILVIVGMIRNKREHHHGKKENK